MKVTVEYRSESRSFVDKKVKQIKNIESSFEMPSGWLRAIRESLGLSAKMLEVRLSAASGSVFRAERRERDKTIGLGTLDGMARAMDCRLVYAIVPLGDRASLESIVAHRAEKLAEQILSEVTHTMKLEAQEVDGKVSRLEKQKLIRSLIEKLDGRLWEGEP